MTRPDVTEAHQHCYKYVPVWKADGSAVASWWWCTDHAPGEWVKIEDDPEFAAIPAPAAEPQYPSKSVERRVRVMKGLPMTPEPQEGEPRADHHGGSIRVPIDVVIANALEVPEAPWEMDTVQGREAWEAGYESALNAVSALKVEARASAPAAEHKHQWARLSNGLDQPEPFLRCLECEATAAPAAELAVTEALRRYLRGYHMLAEHKGFAEDCERSECAMGVAALAASPQSPEPTASPLDLERLYQIVLRHWPVYDGSRPNRYRGGPFDMDARQFTETLVTEYQEAQR